MIIRGSSGSSGQVISEAALTKPALHTLTDRGPADLTTDGASPMKSPFLFTDPLRYHQTCATGVFYPVEE
jgi:hypothetical protein